MITQQTQNSTADLVSLEAYQNRVGGEVAEIVHAQIAEAGASEQILRDTLTHSYGVHLEDEQVPQPQEVKPALAPAELTVADRYEQIVGEAAQKAEAQAPGAEYSAEDARAQLSQIFDEAA